MLFSVGPLILELLLIGIVLAVLFDITYLVVVAVTIALYVWFTFKVTEWRVRIRKEMNDQDTDANQKAIDSLLNFETVKYFGAEAREAARYDAAMEGYEAAALKTSYSLAFLNFGQSLLITTGLVIVMVMAAIGVSARHADRRRFRHGQRLHDPDHHAAELPRHGLSRNPASLVDMGEMFDLLEQPPRGQRQTRCATF